jgi:hypothetical protein
VSFAESLKKVVATESHRFQTSTCPDRRRTATQIVAFMLYEAVFHQRLTPSEAVAIARDAWPTLPWWGLLGALHGDPAGSVPAW